MFLITFRKEEREEAKRKRKKEKAKRRSADREVPKAESTTEPTADDEARKSESESFYCPHFKTLIPYLGTTTFRRLSVGRRKYRPSQAKLTYFWFLKGCLSRSLSLELVLELEVSVF